MATHQRFMNMAIELSRQKMQAGNGGPFGAIIVKNGTVVAKGWNQVTSKHDPTAHAEVEAIRDACAQLSTFDLQGCEIYTSCEPCPMCLAAIYWARMDKIYFANTRQDAAQISFDDDFLYQEIPKPRDKRTIPMEQLLHAEALRVFKEWEEKPDKIPY